MEDYFLMKKIQQASPLSASQGIGTATQLDDSFYHEYDHVSPAAQEISGWTTYLDDFSKHQRSSTSHNNNNSYCSSYATSSLLSDAASHYHHNPAHKFSSQNKKSSLINKIRTNNNHHQEQQEDPLEDTGSSPNRTPKVINEFFKRMEMKKAEGHDDCHSVGPFFGNEGSPRHEMKKADGRVFSVDENHEFHTSLKEMGLCLVPLSLFSNYNG